jgi:hypothetical protein
MTTSIRFKPWRNMGQLNLICTVYCHKKCRRGKARNPIARLLQPTLNRRPSWPASRIQVNMKHCEYLSSPNLEAKDERVAAALGIFADLKALEVTPTDQIGAQEILSVVTVRATAHGPKDGARNSIGRRLAPHYSLLPSGVAA